MNKTQHLIHPHACIHMHTRTPPQSSATGTSSLLPKSLGVLLGSFASIPSLKQQILQTVWKGSFMQSFYPPLASKNGLWAWNASLPRDYRVCTAARSYRLSCGHIFPCFRHSECSLVLLKCVYQWSSCTPQASIIFDSTRESLKSFRCSPRRVCIGSWPVCWPLGDPACYEGLIQLCLFSP